MVSKDHVASTIVYAVVGVGRAVVDELVDEGGNGFCDSGLLGADFAEGVQKFL